MDLTSRLGHRLRSLRERAGLSQDELARASGISRVSIGALERGDQRATLETLNLLARALDVPLASIVDKLERETRQNPVPPERRLALLISSLAQGASEKDCRRFARLARAFFQDS